nr:MAG TPA: hypothetical protein [Caudoviricetes sp.]
MFTFPVRRGHLFPKATDKHWLLNVHLSIKIRYTTIISNPGSRCNSFLE